MQGTIAPGVAAATRQYVYDAYQRLCKTIEPETGATLLGYDAAGNLAWSASGLPATTACDAEGDTAAILARKVVRQYDARNRLVALRFPGDGLGDQDWQYTADGLPDQVVTYNGPAHTLPVTNAYGYNHRRLLTGESSLHADGSTWVVGYGYNANAHLASQTYPDGRVVQYAPNALGQATRVDSGGSNPEAWGASYWPNGALKQFSYGNGIVHTMTQNPRGLPERSTDAYGATKFIDDVYDYDANGNVAAITDGASGRNQRGNRDMTYDGLNRLATVVSPMYGATGAAYGYDSLDNLTHVVAPGRDYYYCYDGSNRLTNLMTGGCVGGNTEHGLDYDVQGNLANKDGTLYAFDLGNRLRTVTYNGATVEAYRYDGYGRRVRAASPAGAIVSLYGQGGQLLYQDNGRDGKTHSYFYLAGSLVNELTHDTANGANANRFQHTDALGSPVVVTNGPRTVLERREYEPYGYQLTPTLQDGPNYTGHVADAATGLIYMQARYYDPLCGCFLSTDPVTALGGVFNRYWYANANPYRFVDPDGRLSDDPDRQPHKIGNAQPSPEADRVNYQNGGAPTGKIEAQVKSQKPEERLEAAKTAMVTAKIDGDPSALSYDASLDGVASATTDTVNLTVDVGPDAFVSWSWLTSTLGHEFEVHIPQSRTLGPIAGMRDNDQREVEAHQYNIDNAQRFHNSATETQRRIDWRDRYQRRLDN